MTMLSDPIFESIRGWRESGDADSTKRLLQIVLEHESAAARVEAAKALGHLRGMEPVVILGRVLNSEKPQARARAVEALGELGDLKAFDPVCAALNDADGPTRAAAARALGRLGDPRAVSLLAPRLGQDDWDVRNGSAESLARIGDDRVLTDLLGWSDALLGAEIDDTTGEEKRELIQAVFERYFSAAADSTLARVANRVDKEVEARQLSAPNDGGSETVWWISKHFADPVGVAAKFELGRRESHLDDEPAPHNFEMDISMDGASSAPTGGDSGGDVGGGLGLNLDDPLAGLSFGSSPTKPAAAEIANGSVNGSARESAESADARMAATDPEPSFEPEADAAPRAEVEPESAAREAAAQAETGPEAAEGRGADDEPTSEAGAITMPEATGVVADFLSFLASNNINDIVLLGGAVRDSIREQTPRDLDVTVRLSVSPEARRNAADPLLWNQQFAERAIPPTRALAEALGVSYEEFVSNGAEFEAGGTRVPVHYVGPYLLEEKETTLGRSSVGHVIRRRVSRLGLVVDSGSRRVIGLVSTSSIDRLCLDAQGAAVGGCEEGIRDLHEGYLRLDGPADRLGIIDLLRGVTLRHELRARMSEESVALLESAAEAVRGDLETTNAELHADDLERLLASNTLEELVEDFLNLEFLDVIEGFLPEEARVRVGRATREREATRERRLADVRRDHEAAQAELAARQAEFEERNHKFAECAAAIQTGKARFSELEGRRRAANERLATTEQAAHEVGEQLERVAERIVELSAEGKADMATIREHREALAAKTELDTELAGAHEEVEQIQEEIQKERVTLREVQARMGAMSQDLESAFTQLETAQAAAAEAEAALRAVEAELELTPELRRKRLSEAPTGALQPA